MKIIFLLLAFIFIFTAISVYSNVENFISVSDIVGESDESDESDAKNEPKKKDEKGKKDAKNEPKKNDKQVDRFKYFKMLPEDNKWSKKTKEDFIKKNSEVVKQFNEKNKGKVSTQEFDAKGITQLEKIVSEEEAKEYIKNGRWPLNDYIKDNFNLFIKNNKNIKEEDKEKTIEFYYEVWLNQPSSQLLFFPMLGGLIHNITKEEDIVGQFKFLYGSNIKLDNDATFQCGSIFNDGNYRMAPLINNNEVKEENYSSLEKTIPGFKFLKKPCNPCTGRCPFSYEGVLAAPFAHYWGISTQTGKSTPSEYIKKTSFF
jgi:hypothetical protein